MVQNGKGVSTLVILTIIIIPFIIILIISKLQPRPRPRRMDGMERMDETSHILCAFEQKI